MAGLLGMIMAVSEEVSEKEEERVEWEDMAAELITDISRKVRREEAEYENVTRNS